ncbi:MAG: aspartate aminotransferase family protein [Lysobacterales bacterium]
MKAILTDTALRAARYLDSLRSRSNIPSQAAVDALAHLNEPLPVHPTEPDQVLATLDEIGSPATVNMAGPRFFGFVIGGALPATVAANWMATAWDQSSSLYNVTPGVAYIEQVAMDWLIDLLGFPEACGGALVTGATVANFSALAAARNKVLRHDGWDVEADGLFGAPPITVITGEEVHPSVLKALGMLGLGRNRIVRVPADNQGRMRADQLPALKGPTIICSQAGNVNTGAFDPVGEICDQAHSSNAWVHVDAAFGLWVAGVPSLQHLCPGLADADSWATDGHKMLNVPYDCGVALVKDPDALRRAMAITAEYLPTDSEQRNPADYTPELSRRARGVEVWAALKSLGRSGVIDMVERMCRHAGLFAEKLSEAGFTVLNDVVYNQLLVSFGTPQQTLQVIDAVQAEGTCWAGGTVWQGHTAMRISTCNWATTDEDVLASVEAIKRCASDVLQP